MSTAEKWGVGLLLLVVGFFIGRMIWMVVWAPEKLEVERERIARMPWSWTEQYLGPFWYRVFVGCGTVFATIIWCFGAYDWMTEVFAR